MKPSPIPSLSDFILEGTNFTNTYYGHTNVLVLRVLRKVRNRRHKTFEIMTVLYDTIVIILL